MEPYKNKFLKVKYFVFFVYFILTTIIFIISIKRGNGVSWQLFGGGDDGLFYWMQAQNVAAGKDWVQTSIYPLIIGNLIKFTGIKSVYLIRIFNYFGFILLTLFSMSLIKTQFQYEKKRIKDQYIYNAKRVLLLTFLVYPSLLSINLSINRDIWIYMLYVLCTYLSVEIIFLKRKRVMNGILLTFFLLLLGGFRGYALLSFIVAIGIYYFNKKVMPVIKLKRFIFLALLLFGIYYVFLIDFTILNISLRRALEYRTVFLEEYPGGSQMWISLDQPNFVLFLINYIHSYIGNLIGPLPWHISGKATLLVFFVETIPMCLILGFLCKKRNQLTKVQRYILLQGFVWVGLIGVTNDNLGAATRLRAVAWILILIVFVVTYSKNKYLKSRDSKENQYESHKIGRLSMDHQELISVMMSVYNEDIKWIKESVESVLNQTYKNLEFIIVLDNPSNSELRNLLESYASMDKRIELLINEENMGVVKSSNRVIKACNGKYIARMDADDISEMDRIMLQKVYLESNNLDFIFSGIKCINEASTIKYETHNRGMDHEKLKKLFSIVNISYHPTWFMKKDIYDDLQGYREIPYTEDYDFILRALHKGYKMGRMSQNIARYRVRETSISISNSLEQFLYMRILTKVYNKDQIEDYSIVQDLLQDTKNSISIKDRENFKKAGNTFEIGVEYWKDQRKIKAIEQFLKSILQSKYMWPKYFVLFRYKLTDKLMDF